MAIDTTHPLYAEFSEDWTTMRDLAGGERVVKSRRDTYLPATPSMIIDGFNKGERYVGEQVYQGYLKRAQFPEYVKDGIDTLLGMLNFKPSTFELPERMKPLLDSCTLNGESLHDLLRRIHAEQLTTGRLGLLADLPAADSPVGITQPDATKKFVLPYLAVYNAESLVNWDDSGSHLKYSALNLVVLNESALKREADFTWKMFKRYRVLQLGALAPNEPEGTSIYSQGVFDENTGLTYNPNAMSAPTFLGKPLNEIPFVIINTRDLVGYPDQPPLIGLAKLVLAIYRGEADYRQGLFMTGQDTLVVIGAMGSKEKIPGQEDATRTGAGASINVDLGGDAKYIGVNSNGLSEQRQCLEADHKRASHKAGQLLVAGKSGDQESGEALKTRLGAQTASLTQIALTAAKGLESLLKTVAVWVGADPAAVKVIPNMDFGDSGLMPADFTDLTAAREAGAPISKASMHQLLKERRFTSMTFEEEVAQIQKEKTLLPDPAVEAAEKAAKNDAALAAKNAANKEKPSSGNAPA
jgi:hypothetical protein